MYSDFTDTIVYNTFSGGYVATRHLLDRDHQDIGAIPASWCATLAAGTAAVIFRR
ncbi:hypothetical protein [Sodalis sp.]|uniref:hypothetical protein n=1 Tax=Sodalis sp. (in: enterobacteria) TaxID=1898979 RepID=UPI0038732595